VQIKYIVTLTVIIVGLGLYLDKAPEPSPEVTETPRVRKPSPKPTPKEPPPKPTALKAETSNVVSKAPPRKAQSTDKYPNLDDSFARFDKDGNLFVTQITVQGKNLTYHGDLLLGETKDLNKFKKMKAIKISKPMLWPKGIIPIVIAPDLPHPERVEAAVDIMNDLTNLNFRRRSDEKDYLEFTVTDANCYSYVGKIGNRQEVRLSSQCSVGNILHELLHAVGFFHEQNRGDRDDYVDILWDNIPEVHQLNFKKFPMEFMHLQNETFSFDSLMMYPSTAFSGNPQEPSILRKDGDFIYSEAQTLSEDDVRRVNTVYPFQ